MRKSFVAATSLLMLISVSANAQIPMSNPEARAAETEERLSQSLDRLTYRPELPVVASTFSFLSSESKIAAKDKEDVAAIRQNMENSFRAGNTGAALKFAYQAISRLQGRDWKVDAFPSSLTFDLAPVADPASPLWIRLRGNWAEAVPSDTIIKLQLLRIEDGRVVRDLGRRTLSATDIVASPQRFAVSLQGVDSGSYRLEGMIEIEGRPAGLIRAPLSVVDGFDRNGAEIENALVQVEGHEDAVATIRYPFSLANELFEGRREVRAYDFTAGVERSKALLASLLAGTDPIVRAKGDLRRAYYFAEADSIVPFRLYVPKGWDGKKKLPLMVFLHGANLDDDDSMERANGLLPKLAEQRNIILLAPLGYRMNSMYGAPVPERFATYGSPISGIDSRRSVLSEQDVINLTDRISSEYGVDRDRIYLAGNSMGAMGTWHLAQKYPNRWAAIAPAAAGATDPEYDFRRLRGLPIMAVAGEHDFLRPMVEETLARAKASGLKPQYYMVPNGDHGTGVEIAMPKIMEFFLKHKKAERR